MSVAIQPSQLSHDEHHAPAPVGGKLFTRPYVAIGLVAALGMLLVLVRFLLGLGRTTALSDGYPWGIWIAFDVVTGTALACGGYALALVVYLLNKGKYHPLVRPAVLTSALGYSIAGFSIIVDVGRPWFIYRIPLRFWQWNLNSALLEVALCVMAYCFVLWIELAPAFLERWQDASWPRLRSFARATLGPLNKAMPWIIALGMLLPTMHQSSLGSLLLLAGPKMHPLWFTGWLPLLFLTSVIAMGYASVCIEATISTRAFKRASETATLRDLEKIAAYFSLAYVALRLVFLAAAGNFGYALEANHKAFLFWLEIALFLVPSVIALTTRRPLDPGRLFFGAVLVFLGGAFYRFDTYLVAYDPGPGYSYFPSVTETLITVGLVATEILIYVTVVKLFPVLGGSPRPANAR